MCSIRHSYRQRGGMFPIASYQEKRKLVVLNIVSDLHCSVSSVCSIECGPIKAIHSTELSTRPISSDVVRSTTNADNYCSFSTLIIAKLSMHMVVLFRTTV